MATEPHCPACKAAFAVPTERIMPDGVVEYRCPSCAYQIPLHTPSPGGEDTCPECGVGAESLTTVPGVDSSGLLGFLYCGACGCLLGRYWGMLL